VTLPKECSEEYFSLVKVVSLLQRSTGKAVTSGGAVSWLMSKSRADILALTAQVQTADFSMGGSGMHVAAATSLTEDALDKWLVPQILADASPGRLKVLGKRDVEWDSEGLGYLAMADFDDDSELQVDLLEDQSDIDKAGPSAAPAAVPTKKMPTVFYAEVAKFFEFLKLFPPHCIVADCGGRMVEKSMHFIGQTLSLHLGCPNGHSATWQSTKEGTWHHGA
jgi:hypothetical protein